MKKKLSKEKECILGCLILSCEEIVFLLISLVSESWLIGNFICTNQTDSMTLGLTKGTFNKFTTPDSNAYKAYLTCTNNSCAFSCRTTPDARLKEILMISEQKLITNMKCDNNPLAEKPIEYDVDLIDQQIFIATYALLGIALVFSIISIVSACLNFSNPSKSFIFGNFCMSVYKVISFVCCLILFIWWQSFYNDQLKFKPFPFVPVMTGHYMLSSTELGICYWFLLSPLITTITSVILLAVRYFVYQKPNPSTPGMARWF